MKNRFFKSLFAFMFIVMSGLVLTACGTEEFDANKIKVGTTTFMHDGTAHVFEVDYEVEGVTVAVTYSETQDGTFKPASELSFVNVGTYSVYYKLTAEGFKDYVSTEKVTFNIIDAVEVAGQNGSTYYATIAEALAANTNGASIKLHADLVLTAGVSITNAKEYTLDLNGFTISAPTSASTGLFTIENVGSKLTINDSVGTGVVNSASQNNNYSIAVWARNGGTVVINGGTFTNLDAKSQNGTAPNVTYNNNEMIYASNTATDGTTYSTITINGGNFIGNYKNGKWGTRYALNMKDKSQCDIDVKGGNFLSFNPEESLSENPQANFVATGYDVVTVNSDVVYNDATLVWYVVVPAQA